MLMSAVYFWFVFFIRISDELKSRVHSLTQGQPDRRPGFQKRTLTYSFFERVSCSGYLNGESACAIFNNTNIFAPNPGEENMYQIENFQIVQCNRKPGPTDKFKRQNVFFQGDRLLPRRHGNSWRIPQSDFKSMA